LHRRTSAVHVVYLSAIGSSSMSMSMSRDRVFAVFAFAFAYRHIQLIVSRSARALPDVNDDEGE